MSANIQIPPRLRKRVPQGDFSDDELDAIAEVAPKRTPRDDLIDKHAKEFNLDPELIRAMMGQESQGHPNAVSPKGAQGLMQLMPGTATQMGVTDPFDEDQNIRGGAKYARMLLDQFHGDVPKALAGYNAGPDRVVKANGIPNIPETQDYVKKITGKYKGKGYAKTTDDPFDDDELDRIAKTALPKETSRAGEPPVVNVQGQQMVFPRGKKKSRPGSVGEILDSGDFSSVAPAAAPSETSPAAQGEFSAEELDQIAKKTGQQPTVPPAQAESAPAGNEQYAKPDWQKKLTKLNEKQEVQFQDWAKQNNAPDTPDYDMRGFWRALKSGDKRATQAGNEHFPDVWKTPLHKTFSRESIYANGNAPVWSGSVLKDASGNIIADERSGEDRLAEDQNVREGLANRAADAESLSRARSHTLSPMTGPPATEEGGAAWGQVADREHELAVRGQRIRLAQIRKARQARQAQAKAQQRPFTLESVVGKPPMLAPFDQRQTELFRATKEAQELEAARPTLAQMRARAAQDIRPSSLSRQGIPGSMIENDPSTPAGWASYLFGVNKSSLGHGISGINNTIANLLTIPEALVGPAGGGVPGARFNTISKLWKEDYPEGKELPLTTLVRGLAREGAKDAEAEINRHGGRTTASEILGSPGAAVPMLVSYGLFKQGIASTLGPELATNANVMSAMSMAENMDKPARDQFINLLFARAGGHLFDTTHGLGKFKTTANLAAYGASEGPVRSALDDAINGRPIDWDKASKGIIPGAVNMGALGLFGGGEHPEVAARRTLRDATMRGTPAESPNVARVANFLRDEVPGTTYTDVELRRIFNLAPGDILPIDSLVDTGIIRKIKGGYEFTEHVWDAVPTPAESAPLQQKVSQIRDTERSNEITSKGEKLDTVGPDEAELKRIREEMDRDEEIAKAAGLPPETRLEGPKDAPPPMRESAFDMLAEPTAEEKGQADVESQHNELIAKQVGLPVEEVRRRLDENEQLPPDKRLDASVLVEQMQADGDALKEPVKAEAPSEPVHHSQTQPRRKLNTATGTRGQFKKGKPASATETQSAAPVAPGTRTWQVGGDTLKETKDWEGDRPHVSHIRAEDSKGNVWIIPKAKLDKATERGSFTKADAEYNTGPRTSRITLPAEGKKPSPAQAAVIAENDAVAQRERQAKWDDWGKEQLAKGAAPSDVKRTIEKAMRAGVHDVNAEVPVEVNRNTREGHTTIQVGDTKLDVPTEALGEIGDVKNEAETKGTTATKTVPKRKRLGKAVSNGEAAQYGPGTGAKETKAVAEAPAKPAEKPAGPAVETKGDFDTKKAELFAKLKAAKLAREKSMGADPEAGVELRHSGVPAPSLDELKVMVDIAKLYIEHGAKTLKAFTKQAIDDLGAEIEPYVKELFQAAKGKMSVGDTHAAIEAKMKTIEAKMQDTEDNPKPTVSIKKAAINAERKARGELPLEKEFHRTMEDLADRAARTFQQNPRVGEELVHRMQQADWDEQGVTDLDKAVLVQEKVNRTVERNLAEQALLKAKNEGDAEGLVAARTRLALAEERMREMEVAAMRAGSISGASLNANKLLMSEDYSVGHMQAEYQIKMKDGEPLTPEEAEMIKGQSEAIEKENETLKKENEERQKKYVEAQTNFYGMLTQEGLAEAAKEMKREAKLSKKRGEGITDWADRWEEKADLLIKKGIASVLSINPAGLLHPDLIKGLAIKLAVKLVRGTVDMTRWSEDTIKEIGKEVSDYLPTIRRQAKLMEKEARMQFADKNLPTPAEAILKSEKRQTKAKEADPENYVPGIDKTLVYDVFRSHMAGVLKEVGTGKLVDGETKTDMAMKRTFESLKETYPEATIEDLKSAMVEYGKVVFPSKIALDRSMREARRITKMQLDLHRLEQGLPALKSGRQRDRDTISIRRLHKKIDAAMRKAGIETTAEDQLTSVNLKRIRSLGNQIADFEEQMEKILSLDTSGRTREEVLADYAKRQPVEWSQGAQHLRETRDLLKADRDALIPELKNKGRQDPTDEQRQQQIVKHLTKTKGRLERGEELPPNRQVPTTPEIDQLRAEIKVLMKQTKEARRSKARENTINRNMAALEEKLSNQDYTRKTAAPPAPLSTTGQEAQSRYIGLKKTWERGFLKKAYDERSRIIKAEDFMVRYSRGAKLSAPTVFPKLIEAGVFSVVREPARRILSTPWRIIDPETYHAAYTDVGFSMKAEAKALTALFTQFKQAKSKLFTHESNIDKFGKENLLPQMKSFVGNLHGVVKEPFRQAIFAREFQLETERLMKLGLDPTEPLVQTMINSRALEGANRGIMMGKNKVTTYFLKNVIAALRGDRKSPIESTTLANTVEFLMPIIQVSANIGTFTARLNPLIGLTEGFARLARAKHIARKTGTSISVEEAGAIHRALQTGGMGLMLAAYAWTNPQHFGGLHSSLYEDEEGKNPDSDLKKGDVRIFGLRIPSVFNHTPELAYLNAVADARRIYDARVGKGEDKGNAFFGAAMFATIAPVEHFPMVDVFVRMFGTHETVAQKAGILVRDAAIPGVATSIQRYTDPYPRKPETFFEEIRMGIPSFGVKALEPYAREGLPEKDIEGRYKAALAEAPFGSGKAAAEVKHLAPLVEAERLKKDQETATKERRTLAEVRAQREDRERQKRNAPLHVPEFARHLLPKGTKVASPPKDDIEKAGILQSLEIYKTLSTAEKKDAELMIRKKIRNAAAEGKGGLKLNELEALQAAGFNSPLVIRMTRAARRRKEDEGTPRGDRREERTEKRERRRLGRLGITAPAMP